MGQGKPRILLPSDHWLLAKQILLVAFEKMKH